MGLRSAQRLLPIALLACGSPFTIASSASSTDGAAPGPGLDAAREDGSMDGDGSSDRDGAPTDGASADVALVDSAPPADGAGPGDGGAESGPSLACTPVCPSGFNCVAGLCEDRAALHFYAAVKPAANNWSYGSLSNLGDAFVPYTATWRVTGTAIDVWSTTTMSLDLAVFHNSGLATVAYDGMTIAPGLLGLYPDAMNHYSVVRWTAPAAGSYAVDATFTGLSFSNTADASMVPVTRADVGVRIGMEVGPGTDFPLNVFGEGNTATYCVGTMSPACATPGAALTMAAGATLDFYEATSTSDNPPPGGCEVEVKITAN